jgi:hypothetical protein
MRQQPVVLPLLAKGVRQASEPTQTHTQAEIGPLDYRSANALRVGTAHNWDRLRRSYFGGRVAPFAFRRGAVDLDELRVIAAVMQRGADRGLVRRESIGGHLKVAACCRMAQAFNENIGGCLVALSHRDVEHQLISDYPEFSCAHLFVYSGLTTGGSMRLILAFIASTAILAAADEPLLLQKPTLSKTHIVFAYGGDLWSVPREGGDAVRLTSGTGDETDPAFSPDGKHIAFTAEYDGNVDVFVVPASGGVPKRLTWHPAPDRVLGWTPDGKRIIFTSPRTAYSRYGELFTVPVEGGVEEKLPLPSGYQASMSPDGQSIAYEPIGKAFVMWKKYRGGQTCANLARTPLRQHRH